MERPIEPNMGPSLVLCTFESINAGFSSFLCVSPAYGYVSLALVKYSNEGGPGPRNNMKEVPGSILIMLVVNE
jgi:hypothetical protein